MSDKIIQISATGVNNTFNTQCDYIVFALTESGKILASTGNGEWNDIGPKNEKKNQQNDLSWSKERR